MHWISLAKKLNEISKPLNSVSTDGIKEVENSFSAVECYKLADEITRADRESNGVGKPLDSKSIYQLQVAQSLAANEEKIRSELVKELSVLLGSQKSKLEAVKASKREYDRILKRHFARSKSSLNSRYSAISSRGDNPSITNNKPVRNNDTTYGQSKDKDSSDSLSSNSKYVHRPSEKVSIPQPELENINNDINKGEALMDEKSENKEFSKAESLSRDRVSDMGEIKTDVARNVDTKTDNLSNYL
ncbi:hypothetical protein AYI68_g5800 [Smittium mucronatum]|uniref:Uncharacterized protein n=1 Tax=Smittium mucronatum TaxID=133383 RepID=A0A1R0GT87_9FUNG|nr:hypothetical protein AYI68_g5800 [Smittium mucronatum]